MRDFKGLVREQVSSLALPPERERKIVEEWAAQLEDVYDALLADGLGDVEAWSELQRQIPEWTRPPPRVTRCRARHHADWRITNMGRWPATGA